MTLRRNPQISWCPRLVRILTVPALLLIPSMNARSASLELVAVADTELRATTPDGVAAGSTIVAGGLGDFTANETRRALLRFDLAPIPANAVVREVQLTLEIVRVPQNPGSAPFELRRLLGAWSEVAASWNSRLAGVPWQTPGALGVSDAEGTVSSTAAREGLGAMSFPSTATLVADVQGWLRDPATNHGWLLRSQSEDLLRTARHFASREAVIGTTRPKLTVTYSLPPVIESLSIEGSEMVFQFAARAGETYRVEGREILVEGEWEPGQTFGPFAEDQSVVVREELIAGASSRFFQVSVE